MAEHVLMHGGVEIKAISGPSLQLREPPPEDAVWVEVPNILTHTAQLNPEDGTYSVILRPPKIGRELSIAITGKRAEINQLRDQKQYGGFTWDGSLFDSDEKSQGIIQGAVLAITAGIPFPDRMWTLADNTERLVTAADMLQIGGALLTHMGTVHDTAVALKGQLSEAITVEEVNSIQWPNAED